MSKRKRSRRGINQQSFWLWFGGIWLAVGVPFLLIGIYAAATVVSGDRRLEAAGRPVEGMVLEKWISTSRSSHGSGTTRQYRVRYRFEAAGGELVEDEAQVGADAWDRLEERGPVAVTYLPDDPHIHRIQGEDSGLVLGAIFSGVGGVLTVLGGFVFLRGLGQLRVGRRLLREGVLATGTVLDVRPSRLRINGVRQCTLRYRYQDHLGRTHKGRAGPLSPEEAAAWSAGARGAVRYDRQRPGVSAWTGEAF
jgi:Protein of unknown function (DUF3592)